MLPFKYTAATIGFFLTFGAGTLLAQEDLLKGWETNTSKSVIDIEELIPGGPGKDGIPAIDNPEFVSTDAARSWVSSKEPVIAVEYRGEARAYPLQILIWHEIVNDRIRDTPILVTFCPLCYSALVFERRVDGEVLRFGVSGFLRHSDMIMYDRRTESLWQQFTGKALIGDYVGTRLKQINSQIISFSQFRNSYPDGKVLSRNTGHKRPYGNNPYGGYDDINNTPFVKTDTKDLPPMEKVVGVKVGDAAKAYPYSVTSQENIIHDTIADTAIVLFHIKGARSALDSTDISASKEDGSTGVFERAVDGKLLTFEMRSGQIYDRQTGSKWSITGRAVEGPLKGHRLRPVTAGDYFAFAWMVFWPETERYVPE
ncbi:DUF3179 domain-containing protein [Halalkalibaculum sp. DA3122]|uniref:DUF3179 domain-containing protein n=1 Tax=Halalkalibaculum sp. DA3122 TaxID=3373607 RepID=UPI0037543108